MLNDGDPEGDGLVPRARTYPPIPPTDHLPELAGRLGDEVEHDYDELLRELRLGQVNIEPMKPSLYSQETVYLELIEEFKAGALRAWAGDLRAIRSLPRTIRQMLHGAVNWYGSSQSTFHDLEAATRVAQTIRHLVLAPRPPGISARKSHDELRELLQRKHHQHGRPISLQMGYKICREVEPNITRNEAHALVVEVCGHQKPGPKGGRDNSPDKSPQ